MLIIVALLQAGKIMKNSQLRALPAQGGHQTPGIYQAVQGVVNMSKDQVG
jgi:hypothetical protein